jgi:hypothetical protein
MIFPVYELVTAAALGALDGWAASSDTNASRTSILHRRATWVQGGGFLLGAALDFMGWNEAVTETLMATSLALVTRELTYGAAQGGQAKAQGYAAYVNAPAGPTLALPTAAGFSRGFATNTGVGVAG